MDAIPAHLRALADALEFSPDNVPLRRHLADQLLASGLAEEAAKILSAGLRLAPASDSLQLGLATALERLGQRERAKAICADLVRRPGQGGAHVLMARLLEKDGAYGDALQHYRRGIELDPTLIDPTLASQLEGRLSSERARRDEEEAEDLSDENEGFGAGDDMRVRATMSSGFAPPPLERPSIDFRSVGGMDGVKEEIRMKVIHPLQNAELFKAYGKAIGGGILLYGPPGCGKTHLARATAGEAKATFIALGLHDVLDMWLGQSERRLHDVFAYARRNAPCVLFFDEVDALAASRNDLRQSGGRNVVNQFLNELDGVTHSNEGVLVLAATNAPWHLDGAFRRPGRFDRIVFVPPPDEPARAAILSILLKGKPLGEIDLASVAKRTDERSGADLRAVVDRAVEAKLREAMKSGVPHPLVTKDLLAAAKETPATVREWFATARNYVLHANESGAYDDVARYLGIRR
jgi:transitional endoplasmic reticulum ATPase